MHGSVHPVTFPSALIGGVFVGRDSSHQGAKPIKAGRSMGSRDSGGDGPLRVDGWQSLSKDLAISAQGPHGAAVCLAAHPCWFRQSPAFHSASSWVPRSLLYRPLAHHPFLYRRESFWLLGRTSAAAAAGKETAAEPAARLSPAVSQKHGDGVPVYSAC